MKIVQHPDRDEQTERGEQGPVDKQGVEKDQRAETETDEYCRPADEWNRPLVALSATGMIDQSGAHRGAAQRLDDGHRDQEDYEVLERRVRHRCGMVAMLSLPVGMR